MSIKLIVGLGNPGKEYQLHRHNAGFWLVDAIANQLGANFKTQEKFFGETSEALSDNTKVLLLKPKTFMNKSGQSIGAFAGYFNIEAKEILVIHDELDLNPGTTKLKKGGGHGGHNGLRDTIQALQSKEFYRLRIGIGKPEAEPNFAQKQASKNNLVSFISKPLSKKNSVSNFVLSRPNKKELNLIEGSMIDVLGIINLIVQGRHEEAMKDLHTK